MCLGAGKGEDPGVNGSFKCISVSLLCVAEKAFPVIKSISLCISPFLLTHGKIGFLQHPLNANTCTPTYSVPTGLVAA